jgi:hypothetical protein
MRKTLLVGVALGMGITAIAQNVISYPPQKSISPIKKATIDSPSLLQPVNPITSVTNNANRVAPVVNPNAALVVVPMGSSYNLLTAVVEEVTYLTANQATNLIGFTHRQNAGQPGGSGLIQMSISADGGSNFDTTTARIIMDGSLGLAQRYPSGVIYNPIGNTNYNNAFGVVFGPYTISPDWSGIYYGSERFDNTLNNQDSTSNASPGAVPQTQGSQYYMSISDNGMAHNFGIDYDTDSLVALVLNTGTWDLVNNRMNWTQQEIDQDFVRESDGSEAVTNWGMAWSQDGLTGYVIFFGRDVTNDYSGYYPVVYKTINAGTTWTKSTYDFSTVSNLTSKLWPVNTGSVTRPIWIGSHGLDFVVDKNNNLHIFGAVQGAYSTHPDSLGYTYTTEPAKLFDVYTTATGWDATLMDTIWADPLGQTGDTGGLTMSPFDARYGARIQASRTTDGSRLFVGWTDTDTTLSTDNIIPDLFVKGYDVDNNMLTPTMNVTRNTSLDGSAFFHGISNITLVNGTTYNVPASVSMPRSGTDNTQPANHYYLKGISFTQADFNVSPDVGIAEHSQADFSVSQNRPNPFNGVASFEITLAKSSSVVVEVYNMLGQNLATDKTMMHEGVNTVNINASSFEAGVYFYSVTVDGKKVTRKMVVR